MQDNIQKIDSIVIDNYFINGSINKYYLFYLLPILILFFLTVFFVTNLTNALFLFISYIWNLTLMTPGMNQRLTTYKYKLSFLKIIKSIEQNIMLISKNVYTDILIKILIPFIFCSAFYFISSNGNLIFALIGASLFFVYAFFLFKIGKSIQASKKNQQEI